MPRQRGVVNALSGLRNFNMQLRRKQVSFPCPRCSDILLSKDFPNHCARRHALNPLQCCVWCEGAHSWESGQKYRHVDHMLLCWRNFLARHAAPALPLPAPSSIHRPDPILFDSTPMCPKHDFFGHEALFLDRLYDPLWPVTLGPNLFTFSDESLNLAASCVHLFAQLYGHFDFFHVMVRLIAFPSFLQAMDEDQGVSRTLPFSTLCDGGEWPKALLRQHRHMIVVSPKGHFRQKVCPKIHLKAEDRPSMKYKCMKTWPIEDLMHFVHVLGYMSRRESSCKFSRVPEDSDSQSRHHFWIFHTLPKDYRLPLMTQVNNGLLQLLRYTYNNFSVDTLLQLPLVCQQQQWKLKIKDLPHIPLGIVLPVDRDLRPSPIPTPIYVYLLHGKKLYFTRDAHPDTWLAEQVEQGNLFYHVVGEEYFTPRPYYQRLLDHTRPMYQRNQGLMAEITQLKRKFNKWKEEQREKDQEIVDQHKRKFNVLTKICQMQEDEIMRLREENAQLRTEVTQLRREGITFVSEALTTHP